MLIISFTSLNVVQLLIVITLPDFPLQLSILNEGTCTIEGDVLSFSFLSLNVAGLLRNLKIIRAWQWLNR
jgi:hypothetical protein